MNSFLNKETGAQKVALIAMQGHSRAQGQKEDESCGWSLLGSHGHTTLYSRMVITLITEKKPGGFWRVVLQFPSPLQLFLLTYFYVFFQWTAG